MGLKTYSQFRFQVPWSKLDGNSSHLAKSYLLPHTLNGCLFFHAGKQFGFTFDNLKFHSVSLGQGQEVVAEAALDQAAVEGHWVILQVST